MADIIDLFNKDTIDIPVDVELPTKIERPKPVVAVPSQVPDPAYTVLARKQLTELEYALFTAVLEKTAALKSRDASLIKLHALNTLGKVMFNVDRTKQKDISFKIKTNKEVELLRKRSE